MSKLQNFETFIGLVCINHLDLKLHTCILHSIKVCLVIVLIDLTVTLKECQNYINIYCTCLCLPSCPDDISATIDVNGAETRDRRLNPTFDRSLIHHVNVGENTMIRA